MSDRANKIDAKYPASGVIESLSSSSANWHSLDVRIREFAPYADPVKVAAVNDPWIHLLLNRSFTIDHWSGGRWLGIKYTKGSCAITPAGQTRLLRHHFNGQRSLTTVRLVIPQNTIDEVAQEMCKSELLSGTSLSDAPFLDDGLIANFSQAVVAALRCGAPDFYAQASAQWLAAHLLLGPSRGFEWHQSLGQERISDQRLSRVLEYINAHLSDRLDLRVLAKEAGISRFHFAALFSKAVGATPHRHVQHLRMQAARLMLRETDKTMLEIALTCGFGSASHFASAFRRYFSQSPTEYRSLK